MPERYIRPILKEIYDTATNDMTLKVFFWCHLSATFAVLASIDYYFGPHDMLLSIAIACEILASIMALLTAISIPLYQLLLPGDKNEQSTAPSGD